MDDKEWNQSKRKKERSSTTYVDQLRYDAELTIEELKAIMDDREEWNQSKRKEERSSTTVFLSSAKQDRSLSNFTSLHATPEV